MNIKFKNVNIVYKNRIEHKDLFIKDEYIVENSNSCLQEIDCNDGYLMPGFIDIHIHGGGGYDFMDGTVDAYKNIIDTHIKYGTTTLLPTLLSASGQEIIDSLKAYNNLKKEDEFYKNVMFGIHIEGPYFSFNQRGAQDSKYLENFNSKSYKKYYDVCKDIKRWSVAIELDGLNEFVDFCKENNILLAIGHTDANAEEIIEKWNTGFKLFTHIYSGMKGVTRENCYRKAGGVEAAFLLDDAYTESIADLRHLPKELLQLIYKIKGGDKNILITDAIRAAGSNLKVSYIGSKENGMPIIIENEVAFLKDKSSFAGSVATCDMLLKNAIKVGIPIVDATQMLTSTPAKLFCMEKVGEIKMGYYADLVLTDSNFNIKRVFKRGKEILI